MNIVFVNTDPHVDVEGALKYLQEAQPELAKEANYATDNRQLRSVETKSWSPPFIEVSDNDYDAAKTIAVVLNNATGLEVHIYDPEVLPAKPKS